MLLEVNDLRITIGSGPLSHTVSIPSMAVSEGQTAILMGPSGSGKSVLLKSLSGVFSSRQIAVEGDAYIYLKESQKTRLFEQPAFNQSIERPAVFYVFQDPRSYLHPRLLVKDYAELLAYRLPCDKDLYSRYAEFIEHANLSHRMGTLSSLLSGGEAQRLMFAIMNVLRPRLVLADEPLSAQDRVHHEQLRGMLNRYVESEENECAMVLVTHEMRDVERSFNLDTDAVFYVLEESNESTWVCSQSISAKDLDRFWASMASDEAESTRTQQPGTLVRYFEAAKDLFSQAELGSERIGKQTTGKVFNTEGLNFGWESGPKAVPLFSKITLSHQSNRNLGIIGLSGVGKSTLAEVLLRLTLGGKGQIQWFDSGSIEESELRRRVQYVFQDCERAMAWEVGTLEETMLLPLNNSDRLSTEVLETMKQVLGSLGLLTHKGKNVQHLSGGQLRRAYLARSLLTLLSGVNSNEPVLLILDEVTVGLDLIAQHELLKLLRRYTTEDHQNMSLLTISHDPIVIRYLCNEVKVLYKNSDRTEAATIVEELEGEQIWKGPYRHEHTKLLMGSLL